MTDEERIKAMEPGNLPRVVGGVRETHAGKEIVADVVLPVGTLANTEDGTAVWLWPDGIFRTEYHGAIR